MEYSSLYELITLLQYGTKLHIGVLFFGSFGNKKCILPHEQTIHASIICDEFKGRPGGLERCFRCRNAAIKRAFRTKRDFDGLCINGVYEYTRPVVIDDEVACIIYIGNILDEPAGQDKLIGRLTGKEYLTESLENNFSRNRCEELASLLETYIRILLRDVPGENAGGFNPLMENIKGYTEKNLEYDVTIPQLAKMFHYNEQYLGRLFKKETGMSFNSYVCNQRIERAKLLLKENDDPVIDIATRSGFNNVTYFNRVFKRIVGITPTDYRKK